MIHEMDENLLDQENVALGNVPIMPLKNLHFFTKIFPKN